MKKLNNKGFAISTVIYGLAIMGIILLAIVMATMASTRSNSRQLAKSVEEELNRFSKTETFFNASVDNSAAKLPKAQEYIVPASGWYKIELWGSSGAGTGSGGAYTTGLIELTEGEKIFFYAGKSGTGRESDVRIVSGSYNDEASTGTRIMAAAGGGSSNNAPGGTLYGYNSDMKSKGGYIASDKTKDYGLIPETDTNNPTNTTLVGYPKSYKESTLAPKVVGSNLNPSITTHSNTTTGGGDGYFPSNDSNIGGTSFIAGYGGCNAIDKNKVSSNPKVTVYEQTYDVDSDDGGDVTYGNVKKVYYFVDGMMFPDVNNGDGRAKIERMVIKTDESQTLQKKNTKLNGVSSIRDCVSGVNPDTNLSTAKPTIYAISNGEDKAYAKPVIADAGAGLGTCYTVNLESAIDLDEIVVRHKSGYDFKNHILQVNTGGGYVNIISSTPETEYSQTESATGIRVSAYQYDSTVNMPDRGNYYLLPVLSENKVVTAAATADEASNALTIEGINGYKRQRWSIEKIEGTEQYRIYELARYNSMTILQDENMAGNEIGADTIFNKYTQDETQYWNIRPLGNGTYVISTIVTPFDSNTGNIIAQTNPSIINKNKIIIGKNNSTTARFKMISVDYSSS